MVGAGGIAIAKMFSPTEVVISDDSDHVPLIAENIRLNNVPHCRAQTIDWLSLDSERSQTFDVIVALEWYEHLDTAC